MMTSKERILCAVNGIAGDHMPLTTWCFGFKPPEQLRWKTGGIEVKYWYTHRLEHIHTLPQTWTLEDDFKRVLTWLSLGIDDVLDVSVPWDISPEVTYSDTVISKGEAGGDSTYPVMIRKYQTPAGPVSHAVKKTGNEPEGWPVQPSKVELFEDYNVPRGVRHIVSEPGDIKKAKYLYMPPDINQKLWFEQRMAEVKRFGDKYGIFVQAWTAFGIDAVIWMSGVENAVMMAMADPESFGRLVDNIFETDFFRTELSLMTPGIDMVCQRGWYSSTDFWSPELFDAFVLPHLRELTALAHRHGRKFGYVMTMGVETFGSRLADAGVDVLYFIDPVMDSLSLIKARELFGDRMTLVGGTNSISLETGDRERIFREVKEAIEALRPTNRFILHPVDSLFPETPWESVETMIEAWEKYR
jgi:hypothetical protein